MVARRVTVAVRCYSGYRASERPTSFIWDQKRYEIQRIVKQWRTPHENGFRVITEGGDQFLLTFDEHLDEWSLHLPQLVQTEKDSTLHSEDKLASLTRKEHNLDA